MNLYYRGIPIYSETSKWYYNLKKHGFRKAKKQSKVKKCVKNRNVYIVPLSPHMSLIK